MVRFMGEYQDLRTSHSIELNNWCWRMLLMKISSVKFIHLLRSSYEKYNYCMAQQSYKNNREGRQSIHTISLCGFVPIKIWLNSFTVVPIEAFRKMLTNSFPNLKEHLWTIPQQFDKFLKKFLTSCFIDQSDCSKIKYKIWLVNETGS
jgi:hypothetical protein